MIEALIEKYEDMQRKVDEIRAKVEILKRKDINDDGLRHLIKTSERFLTKENRIQTKLTELINKHNQISEQYNSMPNQKLLYRNRLPKTINSKTQHESSAESR